MNYLVLYACTWPWVRVGRGANWFGYFKSRCFGCKLPRVQVALGASRNEHPKQLALKLRVALVASCFGRDLP